MRIDVESNADATMPKMLTHYLGVNALLEHKAGKAMVCLPLAVFGDLKITLPPFKTCRLRLTYTWLSIKSTSCQRSNYH